ncbi:MAG: nucleoside monophosphate kinase [Candidatus Nomurabacteria bacterium]|jgi:adenylate kinase|nr:nucleoside monophosphate kinase [Candidatus Nomurabacteria bacterium]
MILLFGLAGSGKSTQGQLLAARMGWRWLSIGQLLRDTTDKKLRRKIQAAQRKGKLVDNKISTHMVRIAVNKAEREVGGEVLDGFPRDLEQAEWLAHGDYPVDLAIVLNVPKRNLLKRLHIRGRADDASAEVIEQRFKVFEGDISAIRQVLEGRGAKFVEVDGVGTVGEVHDRVMKEVEKCQLA